MSSLKGAQAWLALHLTPGLGPVTCHKLVAHFGIPEEVLSADGSALKSVCTLRKESLEWLCGQGRKTLESLVEEESCRASEKNILIIPCDDPRYPVLLKNIHDPPVVLYVYGMADSINCRGIGIVGARAATQYGKSAAEHLGNSLARRGFTIVSGMALGVDTAAHRGALAAKGKTIAVLGCGLDIVYPPANNDLYNSIAGSGAVVSEYPLGTEPENFRFPARNRIISGLSQGIVVVEAAQRSGSLITASHALEQGREVFAVPGRIDSAKSAGTHGLLQQGAKLVHSVDDICEEFSASRFHHNFEKTEENQQASVESLSREEGDLLKFIEVYPRSFDQIVKESGFAVQQINELLLHLELKGVVESLPGKSYQRTTTLSVNKV